MVSIDKYVYLNTSDVNVNLLILIVYHWLHLDLNTSDVNVNLVVDKGHIRYLEKFKYI